MRDQIPVLTADYIRLRPPKISDAGEIFDSYASDHQVTRYLTWKPHYSVDNTRMFLEDLISKKNDSFYWVIETLEPVKLVGSIVLRIDGHQADCGYVLSRKFWNKGFMTRALLLVLDFAFTLPGIRRVWAVCDTENTGSARVMEKAGLIQEGLLHKYISHPNLSDEPRDVFIYAIVK